ncbi:hypothetical protein DPMN_165615 [Dreissena polymorpha]|uniref:WAP domain-containing protein n=1 Tax=Dreissena polymorpha TaxID=45954 RepID=A0A9D4ITE9_DREPO|nr:hypothetical protein DPMN_165615 [Dreissena polymorpha]
MCGRAPTNCDNVVTATCDSHKTCREGLHCCLQDCQYKCIDTREYFTRFSWQKNAIDFAKIKVS